MSYSPETSAQILSDPNDPRHGRASCYIHAGCRCDRCTRANTEKQIEQNRARQERIGPNDPRHGTIQGYSNCLCRCERCSTAHSAYMKSYRRRRPA